MFVSLGLVRQAFRNTQRKRKVQETKRKKERKKERRRNEIVQGIIKMGRIYFGKDEVVSTT
jgi:hypothetical protein